MEILSPPGNSIILVFPELNSVRKIQWDAPNRTLAAGAAYKLLSLSE